MYKVVLLRGMQWQDVVPLKVKNSGSVNVSQGLLRLLVMHWLALGCSLWFIGEVIHICFKLSNYPSSPWGGNTVACALIVWRSSTRGGLVCICRSAGVRYLADGVIPPRISVLSPARESSSWFVLALLSLVWCFSCSSAVSCQLFSLASSTVRGGEWFSDQYAVLTDGLYPFRRMEKLRWWEDLCVCVVVVGGV